MKGIYFLGEDYNISGMFIIDHDVFFLLKGYRGPRDSRESRDPGVFVPMIRMTIETRTERIHQLCGGPEC
jgi:hypothetical protein